MSDHSAPDGSEIPHDLTRILNDIERYENLRVLRALLYAIARYMLIAGSALCAAAFVVLLLQLIWHACT